MASAPPGADFVHTGTRALATADHQEHLLERGISALGMAFLDLLEDETWHIFLPMTLTVDIPDDLAADLGAGFQNLGRAALEALAAEAYSKEVLSLEQIRRMLGLGSLWEAQAMLSRHAVWPDQSAEQILADARRSLEFRQAIA